MAKYEGLQHASFFEHKEGSGAEFISKNGEGIDPYGDKEAKKGNGDQMNAEKAFSAKTLRTIDVEGTDYAKSSNKGMKTENGDHFKVEEVDPSGNDGAKKGTGKVIKR